MSCDRRERLRQDLLLPTLLSAAICLAASGCSGTPLLSPGPIGPVRWFSAAAGSKAEAEAFETKVKADSFPTAAEAGL